LASNLYAFNIILEAKVRAIVVMTRKYRPELSPQQIRVFLQDAIEYAVQKELEK